MLNECGGSSFAGPFKRLGRKLIEPENVLQAFAGHRVYRYTPQQPLSDYLWNPLRAFRRQIVEDAPESTVHRDGTSRLIKGSLINELQNEIEQRTANCVIGPLA